MKMRKRRRRARTFFILVVSSEVAFAKASNVFLFTVLRFTLSAKSNMVLNGPFFSLSSMMASVAASRRANANC